MNTFVFAADSLEMLRQSLLSHSPREAGALLLAGTAQSEAGLRLLVREIVTANPEAYWVQEAARLVLSPEFIAPVLKRARREGWSLILAHTHPFGDAVHFSQSDTAGEALLMPSILARAPDRPHGALVLGPSGFDARVWHASGCVEPVTMIQQVGRDLRLSVHERPSAEISSEFDRSVRALGRAGQELLASLTVGIVGLGGMGSIVAEQLAYLGVGRFILVDPDRIEATNLNRVVGANRKSVGRAKVEVAAQHIRHIRPESSVHEVIGSILIREDAKALLAADLIIGATDTQGSRAVLNQLAYQYLVPVIDTGVSIHVQDGRDAAAAGRVQMLAPGLPCLVCQGLLKPEQVRRDLMTDEERSRDPYVEGAETPQPAVISLNGTVASLAVTMLLAAVTGFPSSARHQVYQVNLGAVRAAEATADPLCVVCSTRGALGRGDTWPMPWRP